MSDDDKRDKGRPPDGDDEARVDEAERAAAEALARALEGRPGKLHGAADDIAVAEEIRAAAGTAPPLGELRGRRIAREAIVEARARKVERGESPRPRSRRWMALVGGLALAAALLVMLALRPWADRGEVGGLAELPARLRSRPVGQLVPGPFPAVQTPADRLDLVTADRLVAFREVRLRELARRRR